MRWAEPSSKVGSCDSASAAAERDSGVDAGADAADDDVEGALGDAGCGVAPVCAAVAGLGLACPVVWLSVSARAGPLANRPTATSRAWRINIVFPLRTRPGRALA